MSRVDPARYEATTLMGPRTGVSPITHKQTYHHAYSNAPDRVFAEVKRADPIPEDARSNAPERHYQRSMRASSSNVRGERSVHEPTHWNAKTQTAETAAYRQTAPQTERSRKMDNDWREEDKASSRHGGRAGDQMSSSAANFYRQNDAMSDRSGRNRTADVAPRAAGQAVYDLAHNKIGNISKDAQPIVVIDKDGNSRCGTIYERANSSQMSNPDNLICDNCANKNMAEDKLAEARDQHQRDQDFARQVNDNMRKQLEDERRRQLDKLRMYQDAIENQRNDHLNKKEKERLETELENERLRRNYENREDDYLRLEKERQKRLNFIGDLKNQIEEKQADNQNRRMAQEEEDRRNPNLLIDDGWRQPHREAMKDYYKNYLIDQVNEKEQLKNAQKDRERLEDEEYKRKLANLNAEEAARVREMDESKRRAFMDDVQRQLADKERLKDYEDRIKNAEDDIMRQKLMKDRQQYMDNAFKKKQQMDDYLNSLGKQIVDKDMEKRIQELERKKRYNTTLCLGKKPVKCYNCAVCRSIYPLKYLNKKHRIA